VTALAWQRRSRIPRVNASAASTIDMCAERLIASQPPNHFLEITLARN
jgi:hypothetical protein